MNIFDTCVSLFFDFYTNGTVLWGYFTGPINDIIFPYLSWLPDNVVTVISQLFNGNALGIFLSNVSLLELMIGGGVTFFLTYTLVKWILDVVF